MSANTHNWSSLRTTTSSTLVQESNAVHLELRDALDRGDAAAIHALHQSILARITELEEFDVSTIGGLTLSLPPSSSPPHTTHRSPRPLLSLALPSSGNAGSGIGLLISKQQLVLRKMVQVLTSRQFSTSLEHSLEVSASAAQLQRSATAAVHVNRHGSIDIASNGAAVSQRRSPHGSPYIKPPLPPVPPPSRQQQQRVAGRTPRSTAKTTRGGARRRAPPAATRTASTPGAMRRSVKASQQRPPPPQPSTKTKTPGRTPGGRAHGKRRVGGGAPKAIYDWERAASAATRQLEVSPRKAQWKHTDMRECSLTIIMTESE